MRKLLTILLVLAATTSLYAHVGSADVFYEGDAGPIIYLSPSACRR